MDAPESGSPMRRSSLSDDGGQLFPVSWLDLPGDLVRLRFSNI